MSTHVGGLAAQFSGILSKMAFPNASSKAPAEMATSKRFKIFCAC